jgi:hypothetical protein
MSYISEENIKNIIKEYEHDLVSCSYLSQKYNYSKTSILRLLKRNNISIRDNNFYKTNKHNLHYFDKIDTSDKSYWLGFLYADGCISKNTISIKLSEKDISHLLKFKNSLDSENKIFVGTNKNGYGKGNSFCQFAITNKELAETLISYGVFRNKSKTLEYPNIDEIFFKDFIRGYFDGDGSVYYYIGKKYNYIYSSISFTGTKNLLEWILKVIPIQTNCKIHKYKNKNIYDLKIGGTNKVKEFYNYIYENSELYLDRKKNKFEEIFKLYNI